MTIIVVTKKRINNQNSDLYGLMHIPEQLLHWMDEEEVDEDCDDCKEVLEEVDVDDEDHQGCSISARTGLSEILGHDYC